MDGFQNVLRRSSLFHEPVTNARNSINFFICSAFEDFELERRILSSRVFPKLRTQCFDDFGIEINLIDLKLGLDARHEVTKSYSDIFENYVGKHGVCDQYNCPIFLFGQKYGRPLIPSRIPIRVFETLKKTLKRYKSRFMVESTVLDQYYKIDTNRSEAEMVLVTALEMFPQLNSKDASLIKDALRQWTEISFFLSNLIKNLSGVCVSNEGLDLSVVQNLLTYELDASVSLTLRRSLDSDFLPIIFSREIIDIKNFIVISNQTKHEERKKKIEKIIDVIYDKHRCINIDDNFQVVLDQLFESCMEIYETVDPLRILWRDPDGVSEAYHVQYIDQLVSYFNSKIYEALASREEFLITELQPSLLRCFDIISDANIQVKRLSNLCCGFEDIISTHLAYICDESENAPMFLYGPANSGKAIIIAKTIHEVQQTNFEEQNCHIIARFVNSDFSLEEIFSSIFYQMSAIALNCDQFATIIDNAKELDKNIPKDLEGVLLSFQHATSTRFLIVLHDLEKCNNFDSSTRLRHLIPSSLPQNMKLIVTTTENWNDRSLSSLNLVVPEFSITEYNNFIQTQLSSCGRFLSPHQLETVLQPYLKAVNDVFTANLTVNLITNYRSFDLVDPESIINESKDILIETIKKSIQRFGEVLVSHIIILLHCSNCGLSDLEVVDLLTLDNEVFKEMQWFHPSSLIFDNDIVQFPMSLWILIRSDLSPLLIEKMYDGHLIVNLASHSVFDCLEMILGTSDMGYFSSLLAEYYLGVWHSSKKTFLENSKTELAFHCLPRNQKMLSKRGKKIFYNYRKFRQLVRHLVESKMNACLLEEVIFNFDWLYYKIRAFGIFELLNDFKEARNGSKEIILLEESFRNSAMVIERDLDSLAGELIGQLLPYVSYYPNLRLLIENCDTVAPKHNAFIPIYANDKLPGSPLASTICCPAAIESIKVVRNETNQNEELLLKVKDDCHIYFYDLHLGVIVTKTLVSHGIVYFGENTDLIFILESKFRQVVKVHKRGSGDLLGQIIPMNWVVARPFENRPDYRITHMDIGKSKAALIVTNEVSYLFIVNLETFEPILAFNPGVKLQMLKLSVDESKVFSHHGEKLISFEIATNKPNSAVELQGTPIQMIFSVPKFNKAFIICEEQKGVVVLELEKTGGVSKCYKVSFDNCLDNDDFVAEVSSSQIGKPYLLIRSAHSVLLYDWRREKVLCHVTRPAHLPVFFKLPNQLDNQPASLQFNAARLVLDDRVLACSLFRDVILCAVGDNRVLTTLHAPVGGIVSEVLVAAEFLIGRVDQSATSAEVLLWRTEPASLFSKTEAVQDRLTRAVAEIQAGPAVAVVTCDGSDEMGVVEVATGTLVDLYSHAAPVHACCLSACGRFALVTVASGHNRHILWSLEARRIVLEFGSGSTGPVFLVPLRSRPAFLCITDQSTSIEEPRVAIVQIDCSEGVSTTTALEIIGLGFILEAPCLLNDDKVLVALTEHYVPEGDTVVTIWRRGSPLADTGVAQVLGSAKLAVSKVLRSRGASPDDGRVLLLCQLMGARLAFLNLDCRSGAVLQMTDLSVVAPSILAATSVHLAGSGRYLFDETTLTIVDLESGVLVGCLTNDRDHDSKRPLAFCCFVLSDTVIVLSSLCTLAAWRLPEMAKIGRVELKEPVTRVAKCADDFTLMVGCQDGSVVSYAVVDIFSPSERLGGIRVTRNFRPMSKSPTVQLEPPQPADIDSSKVSLEFEVAPVRRPMSDPVVGLERRDFLLPF